jgi:prolipoprotein diacylglyceryltransferase
MHPYSFIVGFGASLGIAWMVWRSVTFRAAGLNLLASETLILHRAATSVIMLGGALFGSRISYILVNGEYYRSNPLLWINFFDGGLTWPGAVIGGVLGLFAAAWFTKRSFFRLADALVPVVVATAVSVWLACWFSDIYYGPRVSPAWWALQIREITGDIQYHFPLQPIAIFIFILIYNGIESNRKHFRFSGQLASFVYFGLALELAILSFFRSDPLPWLWGMRVDTWAAITFAVLSIVLFVVSSELIFHRSE